MGAGFEGWVKNSARFWIAVALHRFAFLGSREKSGGGPPQSMTLARLSTMPSPMTATEYLKLP